MTTATVMAGACDHDGPIRWNGESEGTGRFTRRLRRRWIFGPEDPAAPPAATGVVGSGDAGNCWQAARVMVHGDILGVARRCDHFPSTAVPPPADD